jgi:small-conductance mechanosensitive channel
MMALSNLVTTDPVTAWLAHPLATATTSTARQFGHLIADITVLKLLRAIAILAISYVILLFIDRMVNWMSERVSLRNRLSIKQSLPFWRALALIISSALLLNLFLRLSPGNVIAVTGTIAVALGFAFKDYISSIIAGLVALFERPYQVGDRVKINDHYGEVTGYGLRGVQLLTPTDDLVTIPHNRLWTDPVSNANKGNLEAQVVTHFYFDHQTDMDMVASVLYRVAQTSKYTQLKLPIQVIFEARPWGIHCRLKAYPLDARDEFLYQTDLTRRALQCLRRHQVGYPRLSVWSDHVE